MTGRSLSHFDVLEKLGEGGMGVVYKARDTKLNRLAALKVLPPGKTADPERRRRFIQEARAASSLSHPSIVTIYEIDQTDGVDFIAMEFIAGRTLDQLIPRNGMKLGEALRIAIQVADGLARAHAAGIVHRDLKPSNIIIGGEQVKILDFGLAKLTEAAPQGPDDVTRTEVHEDEAVRTDEGTILGTVAYMSPEQAEGKPTDVRTDIFSFGSVLYEMLAGRRAFTGSSKAAILGSVVRDEPPPLTNVPHELEKLIARCMRKDAARRAQHMADLKLALEELKEESESGISGGQAALPKSGSRRGWIIGAGIGLLLGAAGVMWILQNRPAPLVSEMKAVVLTSYPGQQIDPGLSPDGRQVAFAWNGEKEDNYDIYVKLVDAGAPVRITQDPGEDRRPVWSPDGLFLVFVRRVGGRGGYHVIPALGGSERKVADIPRSRLHTPVLTADWTPDSKSLILTDTTLDPPALVQLSVAEGTKKRLTTPPANSFGDYLPAVSPDGKWLAFVRVPNVSVYEWYAVALQEAGSAEPFSVGLRQTITGTDRIRCAWTSNSRQLVCADVTGGLSQLVRRTVPPSTEALAPLAAAGTSAGLPTIARQSSRLAYVNYSQDSNLWRADLKDSITPGPLISSPRQDTQPDYSADGRKIAFISGRSGVNEVWTADADGSNAAQVTTQGAIPTAPRWSPDGRSIAFAKRPGGNTDVYIVDAQGGTPRRMTTDPANDASAYWSRDGKWIYFASNRTGRLEVWKMPADGSAGEIRVTQNGGWRSRESFDGETLYFQKFDVSGIFRMPAGGGPEERIGDLPPSQDWNVVPGAIYYLDPGVGEFVVKRMDLTTGRTTDALKLPKGTLGGASNFTVSPDSRWLVFVHVDHSLNELMMIEGFR